MFPERDVDWANFSAATDAPQVRENAFARGDEANDPDLSRFYARGGKVPPVPPSMSMTGVTSTVSLAAMPWKPTRA